MALFYPKKKTRIIRHLSLHQRRLGDQFRVYIPALYPYSMMKVSAKEYAKNRGRRERTDHESHLTHSSGPKAVVVDAAVHRALLLTHSAGAGVEKKHAEPRDCSGGRHGYRRPQLLQPTVEDCHAEYR